MRILGICGALRSPRHDRRRRADSQRAGARPSRGGTRAGSDRGGRGNPIVLRHSVKPSTATGASSSSTYVHASSPAAGIEHLGSCRCHEKEIVGDVKRPLSMHLLGAVCFVLLIACTNVATCCAPARPRGSASWRFVRPWRRPPCCVRCCETHAHEGSDSPAHLPHERPAGLAPRRSDVKLTGSRTPRARSSRPARSPVPRRPVIPVR